MREVAAAETKKRRQKVYEYTPCTTVNIGKRKFTYTGGSFDNLTLLY